MFNRLRVQLTLMYPLAGLALILLFGGGSYLLIRTYMLIDYYPDVELEGCMAAELEKLGIPLPEELQGARQRLERNRGAGRPMPACDEATLFVLYLNEEGQLGPTGGAALSAGPPEARGVQAAFSRGRDLRTYKTPEGAAVRYLTYRLATASDGLTYLQIGRWLTSQELATNRVLFLLLGLGVCGALGLALLGWWLAGRSLLPAQRAWDRQQRFVANAGHELRTPITLIRASAEAALRPATQEARRLELLGQIVQECDHVGRLVSDLLLLSRLDAGKLALARDEIQAGELLAEVQRQFAGLAEARNISLELKPSSGIVLADRTRLRQIVAILVDNALKYTPEGGSVRLAAQCEDRQATITVEDTGVGIAAGDLPHVFERFYQGNGRERQVENGSGLGLAIAQALVRAQQGTLHIESEVGNGTRVSVSMPGGRLKS